MRINKEDIVKLHLKYNQDVQKNAEIEYQGYGIVFKINFLEEIRSLEIVVDINLQSPLNSDKHQELPLTTLKLYEPTVIFTILPVTNLERQMRSLDFFGSSSL